MKDEGSEDEKEQQENNSVIKTMGFLCRMCNRRFSSKTYLQDHEASHTGEKSFTCTVSVTDQIEVKCKQNKKTP